MSRRVTAGIVAVALAALAVGIAAGRLLRSPRAAAAVRVAFHGEATWPAGAKAAPAIDLLRDQLGRPFSLRSLRGRSVALVFVDSRCTQACPLEGRALAAAERRLPARERPVLVAVSVDPADTRSSVRAAVARWGLSGAGAGRWFWLMGTKAQLAPVWRAYRIFVRIPARGDIVHTEALFLLDRGGFERSAYLYPFLPRFVASDLRRLAVERSGVSG